MVELYKDFNFSILDNPEFEESSVREELITPLLNELGYKSFGINRIIRNKTFRNPIVQTGSGNRELLNIPDYVLEVNGNFEWVLDAKNPCEEIKYGKNVEQAYFYAIHPEIRVKYYALCNGKDFALFEITKKEPILYFLLMEIYDNLETLKKYLSPDSFIEEDILSEEKEIERVLDFDYNKIQIPKPIIPKKQAAPRHFGVHGYFTKQAWNVVQHYVQNFTKRGDLVLDPFGGSGVTLIEALILGRKAISIDLNPLACFMVSSLIAPVNIDLLYIEYEKIKKKFSKHCPINEEEIEEALNKYYYPKGLKMPKGTDVEYIEDLFTQKQLAQLAYLRYLVMNIDDDNIRISLLLAFSSTVTKINRTYHPSKSRGNNAGNAAPFAYYRYRIAKDEVDLDILETYQIKFERLVKAKEDIQSIVKQSKVDQAEVLRGDACHLDFIENNSIDYIYTDPPYGSKIAYLDLSIMWSGWLDLEVTEEDYEHEAIEGGSRNKSSDEYCNLLSQSIREMYRVLKFDRWMSFVFAHKDPKYWHLIVNEAEKAGFEYAGAVKQSNGQSSFKKRQNPFSVLSGQLIINFKKVKTPQAIQKARLGNNTYGLIIETIESVIAENEGATLEQINDELILKGLELGFLDILSKEYKDLTPILEEHFDYHEDTLTFHIKENNKFKTNIPLDLRIKYFLLSYLKRKEKESVNPKTDEIISDIMPLLKNGITPKNQTILKVLETIADHVDDNRWKLKKKIPELFN